MKRMISMLLSFVLVANIVFVSTYAEDSVSIDANEEIEQTYTEEADNEEINLMSVAEDFEWELSDDGTLTISGNGDMPTDIPWTDSKDSIKSVIITEGITSVVNYAFSNCTNLESVTMPDGITYIGDQAFVKCSALTKVILPDTTKTIGLKAFYECRGVEEIYLGKSLVSVGAGAFYGCSTENLLIPKTFTKATRAVVYQKYGAGLEYEIYASSFSACHADTMELEAGMTVIPAYLFDECSVTNLIIPESVTEIKDYGFKGAKVKNMTVIPDTITTIGKYAFAESQFSTLEIPETITKISDYAFKDSALRNITLHNGITAIGSRAFSGTNLENITIPNNVSEYGYGIFSNCEKLTSVTLPENMTSIPDGCFSNCTSLTEIKLPENITEIGSSAFSNTPVTNIDIPDSVTKIGDYCFDDCDMLEELILPSKLSYLGGGFIYGCEKIKEITVPKSVTSGIDADMFLSSAFGGSAIEKIIFEDGIEKIPDYICMYAEKLNSVIIPNSVTEIGMEAFSYCDSLETVTIYDGCTKIEAFAFFNCNNLKIVEIPESVTEIGYMAFEDCPNLTIHCIPGSCAEEYAIDNNIPYESIAEKTSISLTIKTESGDAVEEGYTVSWYNKESGEFIASGNILYGIEYGKEYIFDISFEEDLAYIYKKFERKTVIPTEENNIFEAILIPYDEITVSGTVIDADEAPIANAEIKLEQAFGSECIKAETTVTDGNGYFSKTVKNVPTNAIISANGYYSKTKNIISDETDETEISIGTTELIKLPENKIVLSMNKITAAKSSDEPVFIPILSFGNLSFTIFNKTKNKEIDDFVIQYPNIILGEGEADGEDVIEISITDNAGQMTASVVEVVLDGQKMGNASIDFIENGKFEVNSITGNDSTVVMIFDKDGKLVKSEAADATYTSGALHAGNYSVVFIKKTDLLRSVPSISKLDEFGLDEGTDYIVETINIENGLIKEIDSVTVPQLDESKLYYTVSDNTYFVSNNATASVGRYITMKCEYEIDSKYASANETVTIELPANVVFADGSLTLDGKLAPYSLSGNVITISTNRANAVIRFYVVATDKGKYALNAYLSFTNSDNRVTQPIGTALFTAEASKLSVPKETSQKKISVTGTTLPKSNIILYDNDVEVGATTSNALGNWSINFKLIKPYSYSYHNIYAKIENDSFGGKAITTDSELLIYDESRIELSKITMINTAHLASTTDLCEFVTVFDFLNPDTKVPSYRFWPGEYPKFTFKVEFTGGDDSVLDDVYVVTTNRSGDKTYVKCNYDRNTGLWIGTHDYRTGNDAPISVNAVYMNNYHENNNDYWKDEEQSMSYINWFMEMSSGLKESLNAIIEIDTLVETENGFKADMICEGDRFATFSMERFENSSYAAGITEESKYVEYENEEGETYYVSMERNGTTYTTYYTFPETKEVLKCSIEFKENEEVQLYSQELYDCVMLASINPDLAESMNMIGSLIPGQAASITSALLNKGGEFYNALTYIKSMASILSAEIDTLEVMLNLKCTDGKYKLSDEDRIEFANKINERIEEYSDFVASAEEDLAVYFTMLGFSAVGEMALSNKVGQMTSAAYNDKAKKVYRMYQKTILKKSGRGRLSNAAKKSISKWGSIASDVTGNMTSNLVSGGASSFVGMAFDIQEIYGTWHSELSDKNKQLMDEMNASYRECETQPPSPEDDGQPVNPILDPSGYVYEAVPSNRVEGVKAEAYYYDYPIDEFGMPGEVKEEILWNAEDYDQENPLYTDKGGMYAWDVPMGEWLVKFTKDGYYDTDSKNDAAANDNGYLPVPPPQTEVNTAIVSKSAPTVESVNVYNDEVQIIFSQYMQIDTINTSNVKITSGGKSVNGTISPSNAEYDYKGENEYASIFTFIPKENMSDTATVEISGVKNYNGKTIAQRFVQSMSVTVKPESISVAESVNVAYNSGALVEISILPKEAGINKTIIVSSSSPSITDVVSSTVITDENGKANIMLNGNLPGEAEIKISIDGTDLEATTRAIVGDVVDTSNSCAKVSANIESGTTVEKGTKVTLTTETEGAEIYYTLDGTCPCIEKSESRIKYTGPIEINDDTFIIAYAVKSDMESSATSGFTYKVQKEVQKTAKPVANPVGGQVSSGTEITLSTTTQNATIYYTTDGTIPTKQSTVYTAPIKVTAATTIKAFAVKEGMTDSDVMEEKYTIKSSGGGGGTGGGSGGSSGGSGGFSGGTITPSTPVSTAKIPFKDVKENDWYYEAVKFVYEKGITSGVSETEYAPNNKVTRGQFITMLCRAYGIKEMTGDNFADCGNTWYTGYLAAAKQLGISNGVGDNKFAPDKEITREEMVTLIYNYLKSVGKVDEEITETTFTDNDVISDWAKAGVAFASSKGYVNGKGNNIFDPNGDATRAELAQIFFNMFK